MTSARRKYRIQAFSALTGVPAPTLRAWERRYGLPKPSRTAMAYRLYSEEDAAQIKAMVELTAQGIAPSQAAKAVLEQEAASPPSPLPAADDEFEPVRQRLLADVAASDAQGAGRSVAYALAILSPARAFDHVFAPVLVEVGDRWERGEMTVAQEHLVASVIGSAVSAVAHLIRPQAAFGHVVLACVDEELHAIGIQGLQLHLSDFGVRATVLGPRCPPQAIADAVETTSPDAVGLSLTVPPPGSPAKLFGAYGEACGDVAWVVGGAMAPRYAKAIAAAGGVLSAADGRGAANLLAELARKRP